MAVTLVTGSSGFVGAQLVSALSRRGVHVRAVVRNAGPVPRAAEGVEVVVAGDLTRLESFDRLLSGVDVVIHLAARAHVTSDRGGDNADLYRLANAELTRRLAAAAISAGVSRFVLVSSIKVFGETNVAGRAFRVEDVPRPVDAYGKSKLEAEQALREVCSVSRTSFAIVRPPLVYGPGVRANFQRLIGLVRRGVPLPLAMVDNQRSLVSTDNLVDLLCLCRTHVAASGQVLLVSDGVDVSTPELLRKIAAALGRNARLFGVPVALLRGAAGMLGFSGELSRLTESLTLDISATKSLLGWHPPQDVDAGILKAVRSAVDDIPDGQERA